MEFQMEFHMECFHSNTFKNRIQMKFQIRLHSHIRHLVHGTATVHTGYIQEHEFFSSFTGDAFQFKIEVNICKPL
jgi:hypothetical protein